MPMRACTRDCFSPTVPACGTLGSRTTGHRKGYRHVATDRSPRSSGSSSVDSGTHTSPGPDRRESGCRQSSRRGLGSTRVEPRCRDRQRRCNTGFRTRGHREAAGRTIVSCTLHPGAEWDLGQAARFYRKEAGRGVAQRFLEEFERVSALLVANPGLGIPTGGDRRWFPLHGFP